MTFMLKLELHRIRSDMKSFTRRLRRELRRTSACIRIIHRHDETPSYVLLIDLDDDVRKFKAKFPSPAEFRAAIVRATKGRLEVPTTLGIQWSTNSDMSFESREWRLNEELMFIPIDMTTDSWPYSAPVL